MRLLRAVGVPSLVTFGTISVRRSAVVLFAALVGAYGAFAWREAEERVLDAAAEEGRAVLAGVAAGVEANLAASRAVESLLAERAARGAAAIDEALGAAPGDEETVLAAALRGGELEEILLLDAAGAVVASADASPGVALLVPSEGPFSPERVARLDHDDLVRRVRTADFGTTGISVLRFGEGPFGPRADLVVAVRAPRAGGTLVLRADARSLERFERDAGLRRHLAACADAPAVAYLVLQAEDGTILAGEAPGDVPAPTGVPAWRSLGDGSRVLDLAFPSPWEGPPSGWLRVGLDATPVADVLFRARRNVVVFSLLVAAVGIAGMTALAAVERRRREEEVRHRAEIERHERFVALGRLAAAVAHEIRGPLNAVSLAAQLLDREARPSDAATRDRFAEHLTAVREGVRRADANVVEFLALGRGGTEPERAPLDVGDAVRDAIASEGVSPTVLAADGRVEVEGDRRALARAVANLLRNARQWAPADTIRVAWWDEGGDAVIEVSDGGPGVPPEERERVFEPFRSGRPGGTGLGLAVVRDAVVRHGSTIAVDASDSGGARFRIRLPLRGAP